MSVVVARAATKGRHGASTWAGAFLFGPALLWLVLAGAGLLGATVTSRPPVDRGGVDAAGSSSCLRCHPEQHATWFASWHRTMTQPATSEALLAPFAGESLTALGFVATMTGKAEGKPHIVVRASQDGTVLLDADVELTVGSHRYQQYVARLPWGDGPPERVRLPVAWHPQTQRWIHLSGAFLTPDGQDGDADDYLRHLSRWSDNCIFCHNTEPSPGRTTAGTFEPVVAEFGIACEACHGKAAAHVAQHDNPFARIVTAWDGLPTDDSIVQPARLTQSAQADVCGRCHGQRIARDIAAVLQHGDGFVPGRALAEVSRPIVAASELDGMPPQPFAERFWPDQTPRLSAYEYQGLLLSPCYDAGRGLSCNDCHTMHGPDPDGQLVAQYSAARVCGQCHAPQTLSNGSTHGGHPGVVDCADCHMPRVTYGLLQGMMSHRITRPDPGAWVGRHDQPDACTQCHVERPRIWAAAGMADLGLRGTASGVPDAREAWASRVVLDLLGGDPIQRTLATHALARPNATGTVRGRMQWLAVGLADDYPAVRWMAWRGLVALAPSLSDPALHAALARYDFMAPLAERLAVEQALSACLGTPALPSDAQLAALHEQRDDKAIWIGE